jgi:hypothetical protein
MAYVLLLLPVQLLLPLPPLHWLQPQQLPVPHVIASLLNPCHAPVASVPQAQFHPTTPSACPGCCATPAQLQ